MSAHALLRQGIAALLRAEYRLVEIEDYVASRVRPTEVALVDLDHADVDAPAFVAALRAQLDDTHIVLLGSPTRLAAAADHSADAELESGRADAVALASVVARKPPRVSTELTRAHRLWASITPRQREVLRWLADGLDNPAIAAQLRVGVRAIKAHISALLELFGSTNRTQLALLAHRAGLRPIAR